MGRYQPGGPRGGNAPGNAADASHTGGGKSGPSHSDAGDPPALSQEAQTIARLRQKCISHPMQQCQLAVYVPPHTVGAIIGRGGRTILNVQKESMRRSGGHVGPVRISVLGSNSSNQHEGAGDHPGEPFQASGAQSSTWNYGAYPPQQKRTQDDSATDGPADEDDDWTPVIIRGDPVGCFAAVRQLLPLVDYDHDPDVVFEAPIHRAKHNALVGKGGVVIASLSAKYEARIMIPPNEFMSNVQGGENAWTQNAGSAMLFGDGGAGAGGPGAAGAGHAVMGTNRAAPGTMPQNANVIQLEGEIDNVEGCLVKMLNIVSGAKWTPLGVIVETNNADVERSGKKNEKSPKSDGAASSNGPDKDETYAEATIVKIWTPSSKLLNLGKIRKVQRKTNTVIRRKKLRLGDKANDGGAGAVISEEKEEEVVDEGADETNEDNDEEEAAPKDDGARTATKYIITGTTVGVKLAAAQFEKILGLEPGAATIVDATAKAKARMAASAARKEAAEPAVEGEAEGGGGGPGKKARRKKRGGNRNKPPKGARDGPAPAPQSVLDS